MKSLSRFFRSFAAMFHPPFEGLWLAVLLYFGWCFFVYPDSQILRGNFPDPDNYMYLTQMLDWLKGQGWYDNTQHRLNPPDGVPIHFSRLAQLPMAGMTLLFDLILPLRGAAMLTAILYPLILLGVFFTALRWTAAMLMPKNWAGATAYVALFSTYMMFLFQPGHVDHHGLVIILLTLALGCALRMIRDPGDYRWGLGAGLALALGQVIALEILPYLLLLSGWLGLWAMAKGYVAARNGVIFGLALYLGSLAGLLVTRPPSGWLVFDVLSYSVVYVFLTGGIAVGFAGIAVMANARPWARWATGTALALLAGFLFLQRFPELIAGPYGGMDAALSQFFMNEITEAVPLLTRFPAWISRLAATLSILIATGVALYFLRRSRRDERWSWGLITLLILSAFGLTLFYQFRFMGVLGMLSILPLSVGLQRGWGWIGKHWKGRRKVLAEIGLLLLVGPFPAVLAPALVDGRSLNTGALLFPAFGMQERCDTYVLENVLRDPRYYGDRPRLIVNTIGTGPEILFRTPHKVLSAPYHMNVEGNRDATRFFSTPYPGEAEAIARRRGIELVAVCNKVPRAYVRPPESSDAKPAPDFAPHFVERLLLGSTPDWLKRAKIPALKNFVIYEVHLPTSRAQRRPKSE